MIENLLNRLTKVKRTGPNRWLACCSGHEDCSPSLSIRQTEDGRILLHCFAECSVQDILGAVGMTMEDLFPEKLGDLPPIRRPFNAMDVLQAISHEALLVGVVGADIASGRPVSETDYVRLITAVSRIRSAVSLVCEQSDREVQQMLAREAMKEAA